MPTIKICHHRHRRIGKLGLAREFRFGHICHSNNVTSVFTIDAAFGLCRKLRTFHSHIGQDFIRLRSVDSSPCSNCRVTRQCGQTLTNRVGYADMGDAPCAKETGFAFECTIHELINHDEIARDIGFLQADDSRNGENVCAATTL